MRNRAPGGANDDRLTTRDGLSEPLRVLLDKYPRETWEGNSRFYGLSSFWIERHGMFRQMSETLESDAQAMMALLMEPQSYGRKLSRLAGSMVQNLHGHHMIEDHQYFPLLAKRDGRLKRAFTMLDKDHHALDGLINEFIEESNVVLEGLLEGKDARDLVDRYQPTLHRFNTLIERHLFDEEDIIVPVLLEYGDP
ncbi:MAG: hemerythrin domain-containing protein [Hyphomicrobiales bacterium]